MEPDLEWNYRRWRESVLLLYGDMVKLLLVVEERSARSGRAPVYDDAARCETRRRMSTVIINWSGQRHLTCTAKPDGA